jgi:hypothetical protein
MSNPYPELAECVSYFRTIFLKEIFQYLPNTAVQFVQLRAGQFSIRVSIVGNGKRHFFSKASRLTLGPTAAPVWYQGLFFLWKEATGFSRVILNCSYFDLLARDIE